MDEIIDYTSQYYCKHVGTLNTIYRSLQIHCASSDPKLYCVILKYLQMQFIVPILVITLGYDSEQLAVKCGQVLLR